MIIIGYISTFNTLKIRYIQEELEASFVFTVILTSRYIYIARHPAGQSNHKEDHYFEAEDPAGQRYRGGARHPPQVHCYTAILARKRRRFGADLAAVYGLLALGVAILSISSLERNLILAGSDTTSIHLTWILSRLVKNKQVMKQAQEEIEIKVGKDKWTEESDTKNLV
ncbi:Cytochrome [Forsythia ovata]|uniref:Cytochrome n=1 Tax=Forsythia ovata TaxID=205694 RepID=A0ABD1T5N6_9LAMI